MDTIKWEEEVEDPREDRFLRQLDIAPPMLMEQTPVTIIGAGGIGSPTALLLAKMGLTDITVYDDDTVEEHNLSNQLYPFTAMGMSKVKAMAFMLNEHTPEAEPTIHETRVDANTALEGVVISAVDSMAARKAIWESVKDNPDVPFYIEGRMGAQVARIYAFDPNDKEAQARYEDTLYSDEDAAPEPCTAKAIVYTGTMIGSLIANLVKRHAMAEETPFEEIFDFVTLAMLTTD